MNLGGKENPFLVPSDHNMVKTAIVFVDNTGEVKLSVMTISLFYGKVGVLGEIVTDDLRKISTFATF